MLHHVMAYCFLKKLSMLVCPALFAGAGFEPAADVLPIPPDLVPLVTAALAFVLATPPAIFAPDA